jgi:hypothetical protein
MRKLGLFLFVTAVCFGVSSCDEDNPLKPASFRVTIQVKDTAGNPVKGLRVGLVNDNIYLPDKKDAAKAAVVIQFTMPVPAHARISIEDIEGNRIRDLADGMMAAGVHQIHWNGTDFDDVHQPSGRYTVHMVVIEPGTEQLLIEERRDMLLAMLDSSRVPAGFTNAGGKLVLRDKKLFPHLYDRPDMMATDESAQIIGILALTPTMRISLTDTLAGRTLGFEEEMLSGTVLELVWDPSLKVEQRAPNPRVPVAEKDLPPMEFELGPIYPNPFN